MGGYIRMDKDLEDDPRVLAVAQAIAEHLHALSEADLRTALVGLSRNAALGSLYRLWRYADTHLGRYNRIKGALHGAAQIADVTALHADVLRRFPPDWFKEHGDGSVELPDYAEKNNLIDRDIRREKNRERVRRHRARQKEKSTSGNGVTDRAPEALQGYTCITTGTGTGTGPGTEPSQTGPGTGTPSGAPPAADPERAAAARRELKGLADRMRVPMRPRGRE